MGKKNIIEKNIESCQECIFIKIPNSTFDDSKCFHEEVAGTNIMDTNNIPNWCPLEDEKGN